VRRIGGREGSEGVVEFRVRRLCAVKEGGSRQEVVDLERRGTLTREQKGTVSRKQAFWFLEGRFVHKARNDKEGVRAKLGLPKICLAISG